MTHMPDAYAAAEKREELVRAAAGLLYEQGFARTTLADVAARANVPLGNVYYYFKTKDALAEAVIASHVSALTARFASFVEAHDQPEKRLLCLIRTPLDFAEAVIQFGCPHGSLCQELEKLAPDAPLAKASARMLAVYIEWAESQFRELGFGRDSGALAIDLVAAMQGTMLVAHTMRSRPLLTQQLRRVERWLEETLSRPRKKSRS